MSENHPDGYRRLARRPIGYRAPPLRARDHREIYAPAWNDDDLRGQGRRCMDCGVPTCMAGCPIGNLIPEWNDLVQQGRWREALERLHATNNFPEFTGYTCPAPCEPACTLGYNDSAVTIKDIERAIVDRGWERGWIGPQPPARRSGKSVAIVGSGPAGLAAAQQLNRAGHRVTVYERDDAIGGLMVYGIPDFKFAKHRVTRRVSQLAEEGVVFLPRINIGVDLPLERLRREYDAVCLAIGALQPSDVDIPGRRLSGVRFGMEFLTAQNRRLKGQHVHQALTARGRKVVVLGGGDTAADCIATAHRQKASQVTQVSINPRPPPQRPPLPPWPAQPQTYRRSYAIEEGGRECFDLHSVEFVDENGDGAVDAVCFERARWERDAQGRRTGKDLLERDIRIAADLVLLAVGFDGPQLEPFADSGLHRGGGQGIAIDRSMMTGLPGVFAAGDAVRGASLVVWAIGEGRDVARQIDLYLTGRSQLPASLRTPNPPLPPRGL